MNERQKILLAIAAFLAIVVTVLLLLLPSRTSSKSLDFYIHDSNGNNQLEVNEAIRFIINNPDGVADKAVLWKMGNGDSVIGHPNIQYKYKKAGRYLITLQVDGKRILERAIQVIAVKKDVEIDSIPKINGVSQGYEGEELVFSAEGHGMDTWYWEFGESGTVDAFDRQVVYKYDKPGKYIIRLKTNTTLLPIEHEITILPKIEDIMDQAQIDTLTLVQNDIKRHLQAIANAKVSDRATFYYNMNYIKDTYFYYDADQVMVEVNGKRFNVFPDYCQGLHFLESNRNNRVLIEDTKIDDLHRITKIQVTQKFVGK